MKTCRVVTRGHVVGLVLGGVPERLICNTAKTSYRPHQLIPLLSSAIVIPFPHASCNPGLVVIAGPVRWTTSPPPSPFLLGAGGHRWLEGCVPVASYWLSSHSQDGFAWVTWVSPGTTVTPSPHPSSWPRNGWNEPNEKKTLQTLPCGSS